MVALHAEVDYVVGGVRSLVVEGWFFVNYVGGVFLRCN